MNRSKGCSIVGRPTSMLAVYGMPVIWRSESTPPEYARIDQFRSRLVKTKQASGLFGKEVESKLKALLGNVEQTYNGKPLYSSLEEKGLMVSGSELRSTHLCRS